MPEYKLYRNKETGDLVQAREAVDCLGNKTLIGKINRIKYVIHNVEDIDRLDELEGELETECELFIKNYELVTIN